MMQIQVDGYFVESIDVSSRRTLRERFVVTAIRPDDGDTIVISAPTLQKVLTELAFNVSTQDVGKK